VPPQRGLLSTRQERLARRGAHDLAELDRADRLARGDPARDGSGGPVGDRRYETYSGPSGPVAVQHACDRGGASQEVRQELLELAAVLGADRGIGGSSAERLGLGLGLGRGGSRGQVLREVLGGGQRADRHLLELDLHLVLQLTLEL